MSLACVTMPRGTALAAVFAQHGAAYIARFAIQPCRHSVAQRIVPGARFFANLTPTLPSRNQFEALISKLYATQTKVTMNTCDVFPY
ncbi:hypothetical protein BN1723_002608 [Verticillium longisporum]|uniref:Uncharacterized protein n=1 Tax=Verticillium longisporum TaxID=100787 RepID=A0A0G4LYG2_VERLO|nr:hypothetical protein BN1723_002608 [Verticillium longisporum]CRK27034.1 hypothetical protein BN1708_004256 [Verticillium longisporum]